MGSIMSKQVAREDPKVKAWTGNVKSRDGFACQKCGSNKNLQAHHCVPYNVMPEMAYDINNGITLCRTCHAEFHSRYGTKRCGHYEVALFLGRVKEPSLESNYTQPKKQTLELTTDKPRVVYMDVVKQLSMMERAVILLLADERKIKLVERGGVPVPKGYEW